MSGHDDLDMDELLHLHEHRSHSRDMPLQDTTPRILSDESLQVRQVTPTGFLTAQAVISSAIPSQIAYSRRERLSLTIVNTGTDTVFIGSTQATAQPTSGFPIPGGSALTLSAISDVWASCVTGGNTVLGMLDEYRSESDGA
jgi:hypothetical protein